MIHLGLVSVKDVAKAHIECIKRDEAQGKRFLIVDKAFWFREIAYVLRGNFAHYGYSIPESEARFCLVKFASFFMSDAAFVAKVWGREFPVDTTRSKEILGMEYEPVESAIVDMVHSMIKMGQLEDRISKK